MPQMGVSVSEGTITKWLKEKGDQVEADEPLLEISTDKVDTEVPSPGSGVLTEILVGEGQTVDVGTKLAVIGGEAAEPTSGSEPQSPEAPPEPATQAAADAAMAAASEGVGDVAPSTQPDESPPAREAAIGTSNGKTFVSPVVAKIASEHGVDPSQVTGTGRGGRVTKKDILGFIESGPPAPAEAPAAAPSQPTAPAPAPQPQAPPVPATTAAPAPAQAAPSQPGESFEPMTAMRKGIAKAVTDIAQRARDKKLLPDEVQGGTFTITNPGGYGTFHGTPVISQPQAAILGTYAVVKRPWVIQDDMGEDVIAIRPIMNLTLTYDHRLVDGALAGRFLHDLRHTPESWDGAAY